MNNEYLTALVNTFVLRSRRSRFLGFLESVKRYPDFLWDLLHDPRNFDPATIVRLRGNEYSADYVLAQLRALGAGPEGYLVGNCRELRDGQVARLESLLKSCVGSMEDALVYCPDATAAYYEGHEGFAYILRVAGDKQR